MLRPFVVLGILAATSACTEDRHSWLVAPPFSVGPITASSSADDLRKAFGDSVVVDKDIDVGEGVTEPGTEVYGASPEKRLAVLWKDPARTKPSKVIICYQLLHGNCMWRTLGIAFTYSLKDLERINHRPFKLLGFGWDYSGTVFSWEGGTLGTLSKGLIVRLAPNEADTNSEEYRTVLGEGEFLSSLSAMQKLNPKVYAMEMEFR